MGPTLPTGKMTKLRRKLAADVNIKCTSIIDRVSNLRRFLRLLWDRLLVGTRPASGCQYLQLPDRPTPVDDVESTGEEGNGERRRSGRIETEEEDDLVCLKITCLGDRSVGKTSFLAKYVGDDQTCLEMNGLNLMVKTFYVKGARIAFRIWDVGADHRSVDHFPMACKDADAILFMFDLTSRRTLHSVIGWCNQARRWNQTSIPILIGTKFDEFVRLPPDLQWTLINQARAYARAMKATLFFSSSTHNINVNKIFKFITARVFNLPWTVQRNLKIGEPIIDF